MACGRLLLLLAVALGAAPATAAPSILVVVTDDMRRDDLAHMPNVQRLLAEAGTSFASYVSNVALCCPARVTMLRGQYSHNTGVLTNRSPGGGFEAAWRRGLERDTYATALEAAGYATGYFGKYLNGYPGPAGESYVPPGWSRFIVPVAAGDGVRGFDDGVMEPLPGYPELRYAAAYGETPDAYATDGARGANGRVRGGGRGGGDALPGGARDLRAPRAGDAGAPSRAALREPRAPARARLRRGRRLGQARVHPAPPGAPRARARSARPPPPGARALAPGGGRGRGAPRRAPRGARPPRRHLRLLHLGQRLPPGRARMGWGKQSPYEEDIGLPLVVRGPGVPAGTTAPRSRQHGPRAHPRRDRGHEARARAGRALAAPLARRRGRDGALAPRLPARPLARLHPRRAPRQDARPALSRPPHAAPPLRRVRDRRARALRPRDGSERARERDRLGGSRACRCGALRARGRAPHLRRRALPRARGPALDGEASEPSQGARAARSAASPLRTSRQAGDAASASISTGMPVMQAWFESGARPGSRATTSSCATWSRWCSTASGTAGGRASTRRPTRAGKDGLRGELPAEPGAPSPPSGRAWRPRRRETSS